MNTVLLSLFLTQAAAPAHICLAQNDVITQQLSCCTQASGQQCCSKTLDANGKPEGCGC